MGVRLWVGKDRGEGGGNKGLRTRVGMIKTVTRLGFGNTEKKKEK